MIFSPYFSSVLFIPPIVHLLKNFKSAFSGLLIEPMKHILLVFALMLSGMVANAQSSAKVDIAVYPNPTSEFISVQDNNEIVGFLAVFNIVGRKLKEFEYTKGDQYSLLDLPKGMYLVQIQDRSRRIITTQKIDKR